MNTKNNKIILTFLLLTIIFISSCSDNVVDTAENNSNLITDLAQEHKHEIIKNSASEYAIYFPRMANDAIIASAYKLKDSISEKTNCQLNVRNDSFNSGEENLYEILVGATSREESQLALETLGTYDFAVRVTDKKIIIAGGCDRKTIEAVDYFIENIGDFLTEKDLSISADFNYTSITPEEEGNLMHIFTNPIAPKGDDPWLIFHEGFYYYCRSEQGGVAVARIDNIYDLDKAKPVRVWLPPEGTMYSKELWAPELHYLDGEWYIYIAADDGKNENHRMYVLKGTSQNPLDAFEFVGKITDNTDKWAIDGTVMQYNDKMYYIWSGWEGNVNVAQNIYIAEMSNPWTISSERVKISSPELSWELHGTPRINEGPVAIEHNGVHHIVYSASGSWTDDYCLGLLTLTGDDPLSADSWVKADKSLLSKSNNVFGPGHCSFTTSPDGSQTWVIYHANLVSGTGWSGRSIWAQPITWDENNYPVTGKPVSPGEELEILANE